MWKRITRLVSGERLDRQLNAELTFHLDMEAEKYVRQGLDPEEARAQALKNFGPMTRHVEETRDARGLRWLDDSLQDVRYAARTLWKAPGYAAVAVLTLGLGIGANAAIFSVVNGVLFAPLPYANGQRLMLIDQSAPLANQPNFGVSIKELYDYRDQLRSVDFDGLVEFHQMSFDLLRRGEPDRVATGVVSHNFFDVLGIRPILGRTFVDADDDEGAEAVLVLGHEYWHVALRRRSEHRRPGLPDERPAAHRHRRAARRAALSRMPSTSTCPRRPARSARRRNGASRATAGRSPGCRSSGC